MRRDADDARAKMKIVMNTDEVQGISYQLFIQQLVENLLICDSRKI